MLRTNSSETALDGWVAGGGGDAAVVVTVARHHDVPLLSPGTTPAVLHQPIVLAALHAISDSQHAMI